MYYILSSEIRDIRDVSFVWRVIILEAKLPMFTKFRTAGRYSDITESHI
jgi:hypothetical protein